jgi:hypothetical protein
MAAKLNALLPNSESGDCVLGVNDLRGALAISAMACLRVFPVMGIVSFLNPRFPDPFVPDLSSGETDLF